MDQDGKDRQEKREKGALPSSLERFLLLFSVTIDSGEGMIALPGRARNICTVQYTMYLGIYYIRYAYFYICLCIYYVGDLPPLY